MYSAIEKSRSFIINALTDENVRQYEWLLRNLGSADTPEYQKLYKSFWTTYPARLSDHFYQKYFELLSARACNPMTVSELCKVVSKASARRDGSEMTLQFSFATKLMHMFNPHLPVYDSRIASFYFFLEPSGQLPIAVRIDRLARFHAFLIDEYPRITREGLLARSIEAFKGKFKPQNHTDEKIVDWLIWKFVSLANNGALLEGRIAYS